METTTTASVDLVLPLEKEYARVLRLAVAGIASRLDFSWEQIEDIKLAAEEALLLVMQVSADTEAHFNFALSSEQLNISIINAHLGSFNIKDYKHKYSFFIMTGLVDKVDIIPRNESYFDIQLIKQLY